MDRSYVEKLLANAKGRATTTVDLPVCGQVLHMFTSLNADEQLRVATAGGDDEDAAARQAVGVLRFVLVDEHSEPLLRTFNEAAAFLNALNSGDAGVVLQKLFEIAEAATADPDVEVLEAGKAS